MRLNFLLLLLFPTFAFAKNFPLPISASALRLGSPGLPATNSVLDMRSTTQAMILPRMTSIQKNAIATPINGMMVYDTDLTAYSFYNGTAWENQVNDSAITTAKIATNAVTAAKLSAPNIGISTDSGAFTTSSNSFVDVTNLSVTITASGVRPIEIGLMPKPSSSTSDLAYIGFAFASGSAPGRYMILKDGTQIGIGYFGDQATADANFLIPPGSVHFVDQSPSAGSHTYKMQVASNGGSGTVKIVNCSLLVREM